jgi:RNA polymerase sigma-70 factor (ECF subfamily)
MESDEALFERIARGDMAAFDVLYERFERPLFGFIRAELGGDAAEAEDVLHETFVAVIRERERARREEMRSLRAWLYEVARHLCLNRARSRKRAARAADALASDRASPVPSPDVAYAIAHEAQDRAARLARAVGALPATLAEVYRLRASGLSLDEVARVLAIPVGTVKSRMHELVRRLREETS